MWALIGATIAAAVTAGLALNPIRRFWKYWLGRWTASSAWIEAVALAALGSIAATIVTMLMGVGIHAVVDSLPLEALPVAIAIFSGLSACNQWTTTTSGFTRQATRVLSLTQAHVAKTISSTDDRSCVIISQELGKGLERVPFPQREAAVVDMAFACLQYVDRRRRGHLKKEIDAKISQMKRSSVERVAGCEELRAVIIDTVRSHRMVTLPKPTNWQADIPWPFVEQS